MAGDVTGFHADFAVHRPSGFESSISLVIPPGRTVALLGPNGAGKSTAVMAITGLLPIEGGRISLDGTVLDDPARGVFVPVEERNLGVVFQDYLLFPHLTVLENVAFGLRAREVAREDARERSLRWLELLGLDGMEHRRPSGLSGGQAQRVALARALVTDPAMLLLDEPLSALDVTTRTELRHVLVEHLAAFAGPRLLITHDPTEAFLLADDIHVIEGGAVTQHGTADGLRLAPRTKYVADLVGANLIAGQARFGKVDTGDHTLRIADDDFEGPVLLTVHPTAVSVHVGRPEGSPRNTWQTVVERLERLGPRVRIQTGPPLPITAELTEAARAEMDLRPGAPIWIAVKATEIGVQADGSGSTIDP